MDLPRRHADDVFLPDGSLRTVIDDLRQMTDAHDLAIGIVYAFDPRTHMLPYWYADRRMAPCSVRLLGDLLHDAGFRNVRIIIQQWTPNFKPSQARLKDRSLDMLLVSAMQVHAEPSYDLIREAHTMGDRRPWILAGGPKAIYEPADYFELGPKPGVGADCVSVGEGYVFLDLLRSVLRERKKGEAPRIAFDRLKASRKLDDVPGLVYQPTDYDPNEPRAVHTGVQRLLRDLDEFPMPDAGYRMIEPPHRRTTLSANPCPAKKVGKISMISSVISTHGCKFSCSYCPIPAVNQRTWRHKSPKRLAAEIKHIYENFGIREYFSTDDNFFNNRETVIALMTEMANTTSGGKPLKNCIRFYTEATQFDVFKNKDILPLCRKGGMRAIWFGIEDITADLINKGQDSGNAAELFKYLVSIGIEPMAMMMHNDNQPLRSPKNDLSGVLNQAKYLFNIGAVSYQCTYLGPAIGTREIEIAAESETLYKSVGGEPVAQAYCDGNHVVASRHKEPWKRQMNVVRAYSCFYNPINFIRVLLRSKGDRVLGKRVLFQIVGMIGVCLTAPKLWSWARKIKKGPIEVFRGLQQARIPLVDAKEGHEIFWSIKQIPAPYLPQKEGQQPSSSQASNSKVTQTVKTTQISKIQIAGRPMPVSMTGKQATTS